MRHWGKTEKLIREVATTMRKLIGNNYCDQVCDLLDHNELGLALETLIDVIYEDSLKITEENYLKMTNAAKTMEFDKVSGQNLKHWELLQSLKALVSNELLNLIYAYIKASKTALERLKLEFGLDFSGAGEKGAPQKLNDGSEYQFHGIGCFFVDTSGIEVDFDFALSSGKQGFDAWRLWSFAKQFPDKYTDLQTLNAIENALEDAKFKKLVQSSKNSSDSLFYLIKDLK